MLLPGMLREKFPNLHIGYFQHIPFPSHELFRILPERVEILNGLLGADFVAFHIHDYMRHFISATERILHKNFNLDEVQMNDRVTRVDALPMGINYDLYHNVIADDKVHHAVEKTRLLFGDHKLIISVDRLDYSKGILHRLYGFASFLKNHRPLSRPCRQLCRIENQNRRGDRFYQWNLLYHELDSGMLFLSRFLF